MWIWFVYVLGSVTIFVCLVSYYLLVKTKLTKVPIFRHTLGASSGIGRGIALMFAKSGANLALAGRNNEQLNKTAKMCEELNSKTKVWLLFFFASEFCYDKKNLFMSTDPSPFKYRKNSFKYQKSFSRGIIDKETFLKEQIEPERIKLVWTFFIWPERLYLFLLSSLYFLILWEIDFGDSRRFDFAEWRQDSAWFDNWPLQTAWHSGKEIFYTTQIICQTLFRYKTNITTTSIWTIF